MKAYSLDIREQVATAVQAGEYTQSTIATLFGVSVSFVEKLARRVRETGSFAALPRRGRATRTLQPYGDWIRGELARQPDVTLTELCDQLARTKQVRVSPSMVCRELRILNLPRDRIVSRSGNGSRAV